MSASSRRILPCVVVSARRRSSASSALRVACSSSLRRCAALRHLDANLAPRTLRQRLLEQIPVPRARGRPGSAGAAACPRRIGQESLKAPRLPEPRWYAPGRSAMPPVLTAADEEGLDATPSRPCTRARRRRHRRALRHESSGCPGCRSARAAGRDRQPPARSPAAPRPPPSTVTSGACTPVDLPARNSLASSTSSA